MSFNMNWFTLAGLIMSVESGITAIKHAVGTDAKAAAVGQLTTTVISGVEQLTGKAVVNDAKVQALIADVIAAIADAQDVKAKQ
jgi:hypothetical protein